MNISSVSPSKQSSTSTYEKANGKDSASESVKSVAPELESLGAVGGESASCVFDIKREAVTVLSTDIVEDLSLQKDKKITLFKKNDKCVVSLFTKKQLEEVNGEINIVVRRMIGKAPSVKIKLAGLKSQELIMKVRLGESDKNDEIIMSRAINQLNESLDMELNLDMLNDLKLKKGTIIVSNTTVPECLWSPVDERYDEIFGRNPKKIKSNSTDLTIHKKSYNVLTDDEILEKCINPLADIAKKKMKSMSGYSAPGPHLYYHLDDRSIELFDTHHPGLRAEVAASPFNIILAKDAMSIPTDFDNKALACFNLCRLYDDHVDYNSVNMLDAYKDMIKYEWKEKKLTDHQMLQLFGLWLRSLSFLFGNSTKLCNKMKKPIIDTCRNKNKLTSDERKDFIRLQLVCDKCVELTTWAKNNGFFHVADGACLMKLFGCILSELYKVRDKYNKSTTSVNFNKATMSLLLESLECYFNVTVKDDNKEYIYECYIWLTGFLGEKEKFNKALEDGSKVTLFPMIIRVWDGLGLIGKHSRDVSEQMIRPEYVIQYLIRIWKRINEMSIKSEGFKSWAKLIKSVHNCEELCIGDLLPRTVMYFYLMGKIDEGNELLNLGRTKCRRFYSFLLLIAKEEFNEAVIFMERELEKNRQNTTKGESFKDLQNMKMTIRPLLALLHKQLADTVSVKDKKREKHIEKALFYLSESVNNRKELHLSMAGIKEQAGDIQGAYDSYCSAEEYSKRFPVDSLQHSQLALISQAKEKLFDLLEANVSQKEIPSSDSNINDILINIEKSKPKPKPKQKPKQTSESKTKQKSKSESESESESELKLKLKSKNAVVETVEILTSKVESIGLPFADLTMEVMLKVGMKKKELNKCTEFSSTAQSVECMQESICEGWHVVNRSIVSKVSIPYDMMTSSVESEMLKTKKDRNSLYQELLLSSNIEYNKILDKHDELYKKTNNIVVKQVFLQNRMWTLRHKSFNVLALSYESNATGVPISKIKTDLRSEILETLYLNIENVLEKLTSESLPETWRTNPEIILGLEKIKYILSQECTFSRLRIQIGAQLATIAHVLEDVYSDKSKGSGALQYSVSIFGKRIEDFKELSRLYYQCRNMINPDHVSQFY